MERHPSSQIGKCNIVKMAILPKYIYRFNKILINIPDALFAELDSSHGNVEEPRHPKDSQFPVSKCVTQQLQSRWSDNAIMIAQ